MSCSMIYSYIMNWLYLTSISACLWLIPNVFSLRCLHPCKYVRKLSLGFYESNRCSTKTLERKVCLVELIFDYKKNKGTISRNSSGVLPAKFSKDVGVYTVLTSTIDLKNGYVYHKFTHYCSIGPGCTKTFLRIYFNKYRELSYTSFIEELRQLLRYENISSRPLLSNDCFGKNNILRECTNGKCFVRHLSYVSTTEQDCTEDDTQFPALLIITVPDMFEWSSFSFSFNCYWPLCNNQQLVNNIDDLIEIGLHTSLIKIITTTTTTITTAATVSRDLHVNEQTETSRILTKAPKTEDVTIIDIVGSSTSCYRFSFFNSCHFIFIILLIFSIFCRFNLF